MSPQSILASSTTTIRAVPSERLRALANPDNHELRTKAIQCSIQSDSVHAPHLAVIEKIRMRRVLSSSEQAKSHQAYRAFREAFVGLIKSEGPLLKQLCYAFDTIRLQASVGQTHETFELEEVVALEFAKILRKKTAEEQLVGYPDLKADVVVFNGSAILALQMKHRSVVNVDAIRGGCELLFRHNPYVFLEHHRVVDKFFQLHDISGPRSQFALTYLRTLLVNYVNEAE